LTSPCHDHQAHEKHPHQDADNQTQGEVQHASDLLFYFSSDADKKTLTNVEYFSEILEKITPTGELLRAGPGPGGGAHPAMVDRRGAHHSGKSG
jgi:hypothetical protein